MRQSTRIMQSVADRVPLVAVLAAGRAKRFGGGKLDAHCAGKPVGQHVLDSVKDAGFAPGVIVVGNQKPQFAAASGWTLLVNDRAEQGLGTSLAVAANHAREQAQPLLVILADMPLVQGEHLRALAQWKGLSATAYPGGRLGVPACFPIAELEQLSALSADEGAGTLLSGREDVTVIDPPEAMLLDVDRPEDLARAEELLRRG